MPLRTVSALLFALLVATPAARAEGLPGYKITRIQGASSIVVVRGGARIKLGLGSDLSEGDLVSSESGNAVQLDTDDGSTLVLSGATQLEIASPHGARYLLRLLRGRLMGWVRKASAPAPKDERYRMVVETKSAVMGVRGTQFVVESADQDKGSTFRVLEGVVDVGKTVTGLLTDNFVVAGAGQLVAAAGDGFNFVTNGAGKVLKGTGEAVGDQAKVAKKAVVGVTDKVDSGVHALSKAMPFDVFGFVAGLNKQLPAAFHLPFLTGEDNKYSGAEARYHLSSFELYPQGYYVAQSTPPNGSTIGFGVSWNPTWHLYPGNIELRGHIGNSRIFQSGHGLFGDLEVKVSATFIMRSAAFVEVGPLLRHFYQVGEGYGLAASGGLWLGDHRILHLIDRIFFGTNFVHAPTKELWEYRAGVGVTIF